MPHPVLISDIQKFAVNDGPGFRTIVFLKGCSMRCAWCHNPETITPAADIYWKSRLCTQCGACLEACPTNAINPPMALNGSRDDESACHKIIRDRCDRCMACVEACRFDALTVVGKPMTVVDILDEVEKDRPFYDNSGGGMTLSGGEPGVHADFAAELLKTAAQRGIHSCLDTNGFYPWDVLEKLIEHADLVLFDVKHMDSARHREKTGVGNEKILNNLRRLSLTGKDIWVRIPVIPGFNESIEFHDRASEFLHNLPGKISRVDLLPFHNWCQDKYGWLGMDWPMKAIEAIEPSALEIPAERYRRRGFLTTVGGSGFEQSDGTIGA